MFAGTKRAFTLAEMMVVLLILSVVMAAMAPVISTKTKTKANIWQYTSNNSDIYYGLGATQGVAIGDSSFGTDDARLLINTSSTDQTPILFRLGNTEVGRLIMTGATAGTKAGQYNLGLGNVILGPGIGNTAIGSGADASTAAGYGTAVGYKAIAKTNYNMMYDNNTTAVGAEAQATGDEGTAIGRKATSSGYYSVAIGLEALASGDESTAIGCRSRDFVYNTRATGPYSTAVGSGALATDSHTTAVGNYAQATSQDTCAFGYIALADTEFGTAVGSYSKTTDVAGTALGYHTEAANIAVAIGSNAIANSKGAIAMGSSTKASNLSAISIGPEARASGKYAIAMGNNISGKRINEASGDYAVSIGSSSLASGNFSIAIGGPADEASTAYITSAAQGGIAIGHGSRTLDSGSIAMGIKATTNTTSSNIAIGQLAHATGVGSGTYTGSSIAIGTMAKADYYNSIAIGMAAETPAANTIVLGNSYMTKLYCKVGVTTTSDKRLKNVGQKFDDGLEKIRKIQPYHFTFKTEKKNPKNRVGVMAQDLLKIFPDAVDKDTKGYYAIRQDDMFYAMLNAIKQLDILVQELTKQVKVVSAKICSIENKLLTMSNKDDTNLKKIKELETRIAKLEKLLNEKNK